LTLSSLRSEWPFCASIKKEIHYSQCTIGEGIWNKMKYGTAGLKRTAEIQSINDAYCIRFTSFANLHPISASE
jgi:hypothetical protein